MQRIYVHTDWPSRAPGPTDCRIVESLMDVFLEEHDIEESIFERERPEPVRRALKWMREVLDEDPRRTVTLAELAEAAHVTEKHLCRVFSDSIGHPPMQTYRLLRLQLATALLVRSNLAIKEIADRCGFENPLYFTRCFTKAFGRSPRRVRQQMQSGQPPPPSPLPVDITPRVYW